MLMKNKQCPLSFKAIKAENPSALIKFFFFISAECFRTNELFCLCLISLDLSDCWLLWAGTAVCVHDKAAGSRGAEGATAVSDERLS